MKAQKTLITTVCLAGSINISEAAKTETPVKNITGFLRNEIECRKTPSVQYSFFDLDSTIYEFSYGFSDLQNRKLAADSTRYNLYSVTKTFTALAILQLAQEGKISLNESASVYLPSFPYSPQITVMQLLNHTSGIPNPMPLSWIHLPAEHKTFDRNTFFSDIFSRNYELLDEPGTRFTYSNLGYVLLGQIIEKVSGKSFEQYVDQEIILRSGIQPADLSFELDTNHQAIGYQKQWSIANALLGCFIEKHKFMGEAEQGWKPFRFFYNNGAPYGGMFGTLYGLRQYAQVLLSPDSVLINPQYKKVLFTEAITNGKPTGMSLSWFKGSLKGHTYYSHAGGGGGYYVELRIYPSLGVGSVIMFNRTGLRDERILDRTDSYFISSF